MRQFQRLWTFYFGLIVAIIIGLFVRTYGNGGQNDLEYLRMLDDRLMYRIAYKSAEEFPKELEESKEKLVEVTSPDQEQYQCLIPSVNIYSKKRIESYTGPTPAQLLQPIYDDNVCSFKFETYWNYELCHGRYVMQYHEEKETKKKTEYYLGNFVSVSAIVEAKHFDQLSPPMKKVGDEMRAYYPVTYTHGTVCDITGKPRQTVVMYVCDEDARQNIYSFTEASSCQYEIIVLSSELCAHPAFQVIPNKEHEISCFAINKGPEEDPKPKALTKIEEENVNHFIHEYALFKDASSAKSTKQIFSKLFQVEEEVIEDGFNQLNAILESIKKATQQQNTKPTGRASLASKEQQKKPSQSQLQSPPTEMQKIVEGFWRGDVCLHGGAGWWRHEVCYRKTVNQYHQEAGKARQNIILGVFDEEVHKAWARENPEKAVEPKFGDGKIMQVTNMYTQGDICPENGAHRSCEVRMRCRDDITAQKVFIYMLEPTTCQYIVVIESPLFCDALQKVDKYGLFPEGSFDAPTRVDSTEENDGDSEQTSAGVEEENMQMQLENSDGTVKKMHKAKVEIGIMNQEEIMRIVQNLVQGMDGQVTLDVRKVKIPFGSDEEEEEEESATTADGGQKEELEIRETKDDEDEENKKEGHESERLRLHQQTNDAQGEAEDENLRKKTMRREDVGEL